MSPIKITIDQEYVENLVNSRIDDLLNQDLSGITWSLDEFRKKCCGNQKPSVGSALHLLEIQQRDYRA